MPCRQFAKKTPPTFPLIPPPPSLSFFRRYASGSAQREGRTDETDIVFLRLRFALVDCLCRSKGCRLAMRSWPREILPVFPIRRPGPSVPRS